MSYHRIFFISFYFCVIYFQWEVGNLCIQLVIKFLKQYEPQVEDFIGILVQTEDGNRIQVCPHPGFHVMINLCSHSEFFRVVSENYALLLLLFIKIYLKYKFKIIKNMFLFYFSFMWSTYGLF